MLELTHGSSLHPHHRACFDVCVYVCTCVRSDRDYGARARALSLSLSFSLSHLQGHQSRSDRGRSAGASSTCLSTQTGKLSFPLLSVAGRHARERPVHGLSQRFQSTSARVRPHLPCKENAAAAELGSRSTSMLCSSYPLTHAPQHPRPLTLLSRGRSKEGHRRKVAMHERGAQPAGGEVCPQC